MTRILKTDALVLHSLRWSESSKIIHLFTAEKGSLKAIARGVLRPKSSLRGVLENLNQVQVVLSVKESRGLQIISQADLLNPFTHIRENLDATAMAFSIMELLRSLIHENEASQEIFRYTSGLLQQLNRPDISHPLLFLLSFIVHFSEYLGFGWQVEECRKCRKLPESFPVKADIVNGSITCARCATSDSHPQQALSKLQWRLLFRLQQEPPSGLPALMSKIPTDLNMNPLLDLLLAHLNYHTDQSLQLKSLKMYLP
ncbi:MAG: DNA repair protein RecO [bacterium]|nr:MAG: DNA repair protein RecO [bacterium]